VKGKTVSKYKELRGIDVTEHIERKNSLSYLSWAWAVDTLLSHDEKATWSYSPPAQFGETLMVFCTVTAFGKSMTAQLPVMDYRNKAIPNPDSFAVNTAMQRCLAKAIALHGIGLYIYAGEDLPPDEVQADYPVDFYIGALQATESPAELRTAYAQSYPKFSKNKADQAKLVTAYEKMKAQLNETSESAAG
jgi:hypothetical protein